MAYSDIAAMARDRIGKYCKACPVCDGRACSNQMPGPGSKGTGTVAAENYRAWQRIRINMDTIHSPQDVSCAARVLGRELSVPVMIAPVGDVGRHYGPDYDTDSYNRCILRAAASYGTLAWTGDGRDESIVQDACEAIKEIGGIGIPTIKPWDEKTLHEKISLAVACDPVAIAMDVDAAGLPFLKGLTPPAGSKSVADLAEVASMCEGVPFVVKGVMTPWGAEKAAEAGASAIVVSNHGGRVLDGVPPTAEVLPEIAYAVGDDLDVLVDGGIRSGIDVFRAIALGADACLICRPFVVAAYGAGEKGIVDYLDQLSGELLDAMDMCGCSTVYDIDDDKLFSPACSCGHEHH